MKKIANKIG